MCGVLCDVVGVCCCAIVLCLFVLFVVHACASVCSVRKCALCLSAFVRFVCDFSCGGVWFVVPVCA